MREQIEFVFGYGSLAAGAGGLSRQPSARGSVTTLRGFRRGWGVAMDNTRMVPGYKYYVRDDGSRPAVHVAYLDIAGDPACTVNGVCMPVSAEQLAALDDRERNYVRREVTESVELVRGRVWAYVGSRGGRRRLDDGIERGVAVVSREYADGVHAAFRALGEHEYALCAPSLHTGELPVWELRTVPLAPAPTAPSC